MSSTIRIKRSSVAGKLPNTTNLSTGELALNLTDGRLYSSNGIHIFEVGANVASLSVGSGGFSVGNGAYSFPMSDGASGAILTTDGSGQLSFDSTLALDSVNNFLGINQSNPEVTLHMTAEGAQTAQIRMEQYNDSADAPDVRTRRYRGTEASPSAVQSGDYLFRSNHEYFNGTSLIVGGAFAFDNTNNAARTQFSVAVDTDGTGADPQGNNGQFKIDGNDGGAITFNNAYKFPTSDGTDGQALLTDGNGTLTFQDVAVANAITLAVSNTLSVTGNTTVGGNLTVEGDLNVTGDVTLTSICNTSIYFATGGETKVAVGYTNTNLVVVTLNGSELTPTYDYTSTDNINIGNLEPLDAGDVIVIKEFKGTTNNIRVL